MAVPVSKHLVTLALAASISVASVEISVRETPAQTALPAIAGTLRSLERAAGVTDPSYSSPAVVANTKSLDPAAATKAWLATVPRDQREKSDAYFEGGYWLLLWNFLLIAAISVFLLESRISARLRDFAERVCRGCRGSWQLPVWLWISGSRQFLPQAFSLAGRNPDIIGGILRDRFSVD